MVNFEAFHWFSSSTKLPEIERSENIPVDRIEQFRHAWETQLDKNDHGDIGIWGWPNILLECLWLLYKSHLTNIFSAERNFVIVNYLVID